MIEVVRLSEPEKKVVISSWSERNCAIEVGDMEQTYEALINAIHGNYVVGFRKECSRSMRSTAMQ